MNIAVVTGASSGMGREFCKRFDGFGFDEIWGIALEADLLETLKKELKTPFKPLALDLTKKSSFTKYKQELKKYKPNVLWLANCSGYAKFGSYYEIPTEISSNMIELNCIGLVRMTEYTLPYMEAGGRIIQIASVGAFQPVPYMNVYAASKTFVLHYARALNIELEPRKISVTCVCPFWTKTNFFNVAQKTKANVVTNYAAMYEPEQIINKAIKDATKRKELSICGFIARTQVRLVRMLPPRLVMRVWMVQQGLRKKYKK